MSWPISMMRLRIISEGRKTSFWLPLFLLWPMVLIFGIILFPLVLLIDFISWMSGYRFFLIYLYPLGFRLACAMRGFRVELKQTNKEMLVSFY